MSKYSNVSRKWNNSLLISLWSLFIPIFIVGITEPAQAKSNTENNTVNNALSFIRNNPGCNPSRLTSSIGCSGIYSGNDSNANLSGLFGVNTWQEYTKLNAPTQSNSLLTLTGNGTRSGSWELKSPLSEYSSFMIILKAANTFTAYQVSGITSKGLWTTDDLRTNNGGIPALSHFSIYTSNSLKVPPKPPGSGTPPGSAVPEPLTILGAATASGLGMLFKRRFANSQYSQNID